MAPRTPEPPDFPASQLFLRRLAYSLVRDEARAEDLVQDTWAAWVEHRPSGVAEPRAWLARVLRNRAFNEKRGERRRAEREELAGRPDPSAPETEGTLEAQAQLLEALRKLEEPYRSTLVERYYHDLSPKEIAGRSGTPLNTIKARLQRGLERLRAEMDRRYRGDRGAWCHWLMPLCAPVAPISAPHGTTAAPQGAAPFAGMGGGGGMSLLGWLALAGVMAVGAVLKMEWGRRPRGEKGTADERQASVPSKEPFRAERRPVPVKSDVAEQPRASAPLKRPELPAAPGRQLTPASAVRSSSAARETFEWPQYAGGPEHDNYREREDEILAPVVRWFVPGCAGQPTLEGGDLYTGGMSCFRLDPGTGEFEAAALELWAEGLGVDPEATGERAEAEALALLEKLEDFDPNDPSHHAVAPAPVITSDLVLVRRTRDGGVTAFDRELAREVWSWPPGPVHERKTLEAPWSCVPLCLASEKIVLVAWKHSLVALRVANGEELWRFACHDNIRMVPASDGQRVFVGTEEGLFFAIDLETRVELWKRSVALFGTTTPAVIGGRVLAADARGLKRWSFPAPDELEGFAAEGERGELHAFDVDSGRELWSTPFDGFRSSNFGVGPEGSYVVAGYGTEVGRFAVLSGKRDEPHRVEAAPHPYGSPTVVGKSLVFGTLDGMLHVCELDSGKARFRFWPVNAKVFDFVHTGSRIYVSTSIGLFCIADDPTQAPPAAGYVLEWRGNPREQAYYPEDEAAQRK